MIPPHHRFFALPETLPAMLLLMLLFSRPAAAGNYLSPDAIDGSIKIDAETLITLADEYADLVIIDSRLHSDLRQGFITGAVNLPDTGTDCKTLAKVIPGKTTPVVFYCNGPRCRRSDRAVAIARDCGYRHLYWFRGGFEEWQDKKYMISK